MGLCTNTEHTPGMQTKRVPARVVMLKQGLHGITAAADAFGVAAAGLAISSGGINTPDLARSLFVVLAPATAADRPEAMKGFSCRPVSNSRCRMSTSAAAYTSSYGVEYESILAGRLLYGLSRYDEI